MIATGDAGITERTICKGEVSTEKTLNRHEFTMDSIGEKDFPWEEKFVVMIVAGSIRRESA